MPDFIKAEEVVRGCFPVGANFTMDGKNYTVKFSGKPKPQRGKGEPKTDIYVMADSISDSAELKISYKKTNADFLENKMNAERAQQIFGDDWENVIKEATKGVAEDFDSSKLIFLDKRGRTEEGSMTIGWRFELFNKPQGERSGKMTCMSRDQVYEVYAGEKLSEVKRNAKVNGRIIQGSGIANYILVADSVGSAQEVIDKMEPIEDYIAKNPDVYFGCKALNYRSKKNKIEGNRALSVQVDYKVIDEALEVDIEYEKPLKRSGKEMKQIAESCLKALKKKDATELSSSEIVGIPTYKKDN